MKIRAKQDLSQSLVSLLQKVISLVKRKPSNRNRTRALRCEGLEARQLFAADSFVGIFEAGRWSLSDNPAQQISFGLPGDQPVIGDWNGDGRETPGVYRNGIWVLDLTGNGFDANDKVLQFGLPGDKAVAGDWDGDGIDTVGVFRDGAWFFDRNGNGYDEADVDPVFFGLGSDTPVSGDWQGDGKDTPGIYRAGTWVLDLSGNGFDAGDRFLQFGLPGDQPVSGDWNKDGKDTPGVLQNNRWFFDLEGNGYTGEVGTWNNLQTGGIAVAGESSIGPRETETPSGGGDVGSPGPAMPPKTGEPGTPTSPPSPVLIPEVTVEGIADGQATSVSFGDVKVGQVVVRDFKVHNSGNATLTLEHLQVPSGFTIIDGLPSSLAPNAFATFRIGMTTLTPGTHSGTLSFKTNDSDESVYNFNIIGSVTPTPPTPPVSSPEITVEGISDGQADAISFGDVKVGQNATRTFTIRNTGNATLTLRQLQVPSGFTILSGLPRNLAPNSTTALRIGMVTSTAGSRSGTISFVTNDMSRPVFNFDIKGSVTAPVTSNFGSVLSFLTSEGTSGSIVLKTVRNYNATGNNLRLYADFFSPTGAAIRTDVLIGQPNNAFGNQTTPQILSLDSGRYVIAWRGTSLSGRKDIHYSILDPYGIAVGSSDRTANIGHSTNLELKSISKVSNGFRLSWLDLSNNRSIRRTFNMVGIPITGEIRN